MPVRHISLVADAVTTVTVTSSYDWVGVLHKGNVADDVWVTINGVDPVANGDDNYLVSSGVRRRITGTARSRSIKLLSAGTVNLEVEFA